MDERRNAKRVAFACEVECYNVGAGANPLNPRISDLSTTGAFVDSVMALPVGAVLKLKFDLPSLQVVVQAEVVQSMPQFGMGVRFLDLTAVQRSAIQQIVDREG